MKLIIVVLFLFPLYSYSQEEVAAIFYTNYDTPPEFPGGNDAFSHFITDNFKYPEQALKDSIQGKIWIQFMINTDGKVSNINIVKGLSEQLNKEAIRVFKLMPKWKAGEMKGKKVNVNFNSIPITVKLM